MALGYIEDGYIYPDYVQEGITVIWETKEIFVPRDTMLKVQSTPVEIRQLDLYEFHNKLRELEAEARGMVWDITHEYIPPKEISGVPLARVINIINDYTVTFEDGLYNVNIKNGNSNIADRVNKNSVGVNTSNSAGLQDLSSLQAASFGDGAVALDQLKGTDGTIYPIGTRGSPARRWADAKAIANSRNMSKIIVIGTAIAGLGDDISNMTIIGTNPMVSILVVYDEAVTTNVYIQECYFTGILDGGTILRNCVVGNTHYFDGFIENCAIAADVIAINGTGTFINCREGNKVLSDFVIDMTTGDNLFVRDFSGDMVIANKTTDGIVEIKIDGKVTIHPSCTAGTYNIYGDGHVVNLSNVIVNDKTTGSPQEIADAVWSKVLP